METLRRWFCIWFHRKHWDVRDSDGVLYAPVHFCGKCKREWTLFPEFIPPPPPPLKAWTVKLQPDIAVEVIIDGEKVYGDYGDNILVKMDADVFARARQLVAKTLAGMDAHPVERTVS